ncbi:MAG: nitroreductase, partial [Oscillibacter sp.]|nr:nitroreductase [Oscillibacter sp.]
MDFQNLSAARYSLRKFSSQPVEPEKLAQIL